MNTKKQQCIANAYGEYWEQVKPYVSSNGWILVTDLLRVKINPNSFGEIEVDDIEDISAYRPLQLKGIETNNNWVSIESEDDLPKEFDRGKFKLNYWTNGGFYNSEDYKRWKLHYDHLQITHYQLIPIESPKQPHY